MMWNRKTRILLQSSVACRAINCHDIFYVLEHFFKFHDFLSTLIIQLKFPDFFKFLRMYES